MKDILNEWIPIEDQLPENGQKVLLLMIHWKNYFPLSYEITGMEFIKGTEEEGTDKEQSRFEDCDSRGQGEEYITLSELRVGYNYWMPEEKAKEILPIIFREDVCLCKILNEEK